MACFDALTVPPFEGPEKKLEVDFFPNPFLPRGLRTINASRWQEMLTLINCTILSEISNEFCDSYLLSESSLFVYPYKVMIKTCGKITLLHCLEYLTKLSREFDTVPSRISFSRRNLFFPEEQPAPHGSFDDEVAYLKTHFPKGEAHIFGPRSCDHHYYFIYHTDEPNPYESVPLPDNLPIGFIPSARHQTLEVLMTGMGRRIMNQFYMSENFISSRETSSSSGILDLFTKQTIVDDHQFEPLGYSMNGIDDQIYYTIHITPQPECSFVSFETNLVIKDYPSLVKRVVDVFQPLSFTVLIVGDSVPEEVGYNYEGFYARNHAHHSFKETGHHLSFFSFRQHGHLRRASNPPQSKSSSSMTSLAATQPSRLTAETTEVW